MYEYKAPLRDFEFTYFELMEYEDHLKSLPKYKDLTPETWKAILEEYAKLVEGEIVPLFQNGDQGCKWEEGVVTTPTGFREAYQRYAEAGWQSMAYDEELGGMGLPESLYINTMEMRGVNWAWTSMIGFGKAASPILMDNATPEIRDMFLPKIVTGEWVATMCLTEPHCGTDLGMLRTKAEPAADGTYRLTGTKIFITAGEHDFTDNIVHFVLARIEGAPGGTSGISMFAVPKFNVENGEVADRNGVVCGSIESKMGLKGSATCVMNFDDAKAYLLGEPNKGLQAMFAMMNSARIGTGLQGVCHAELGYQQAAHYARERLQSRSLTGPKNPDGPADPIIVHPDVRRMLLTQKAFAEGGRMFVAYCGKLVDRVNASDDPEVVANAQAKLAFLTPIAKAFLSEAGVESASLAIQCFGGHGYIKEWGVEQNFRDSRIATLYEGTTGIQALDLLGRKVVAANRAFMDAFVADVEKLCEENQDYPLTQRLSAVVHRWQELSEIIGGKSTKNPDEIGAASFDYIMFSGYAVIAYYWARAALVAEQKIAEGTSEKPFYDAKIKTATFYFDRILARTEGHATAMLSGADNLMGMEDDQFLLQF